MQLRSELYVGGLLVVTLAVLFCLYLPALEGPFLFDDIPNLSPLGYFNGVQDWPSALYFIFGNQSGSLGRILSMASFLVNDNGWPADAYSFKFTNLLLHLINFLLVFQLSRMVAKELMVEPDRRELFGLIAASIWAFHPIHISAVMLVVQRMTLLAGTFELLACIGYLQLRAGMHSLRSALWSAIALGSLLVLGAFAKETAVMAIFFIAALEFFVMRDRKVYFLVRPTLAIVCFIGVGAVIFLGFHDSLSWSRREFTMPERMLTELRILWDYLGNFLFPRPSDFSLFNDDYVISRSLTNPISTLWSLLGWGVVLVGIFVLRRRSTFIVLGFVWFLAGHLLESTIIPLELYFDHRNYLPVLGFCWWLAWLAIRLPVTRLGRISIVLLTLGLVAFVSHSVLYVWRSESMMANIWASEHPGSPRAQQMLLREALSTGDAPLADRIATQSLINRPSNPHLALQKLIISCLLDREQVLAEYANVLATGEFSTGVRDAISKIRDLVFEHKCEWLSVDDLEVLYAAFESNPIYQSKDDRSYVAIERSKLAAAKGDLDSAIKYLDKAYVADPQNIQFPLTQAYWLADAGLRGPAEAYLNVAENTRPPHPMQIYQYRKLVSKARAYINERLDKRESDNESFNSNPRQE